MNAPHRDWFPVILIGLTLALAFVFAGIFLRPSNAPSTPAVQAMTDEEYKAAATTILSAYANDNDAAKAYSALLAFRIPPEDKDVHLNLVVDLGEIVRGDASASARLNDYLSTLSWLSL